MEKIKMNKNIIINIIFQISNILYGLVLPRLIITLYGSELNGLISAALQFVGYMKVIEAGLSAAAIKEFYQPLADKNHKEISDLFQSVRFYYNKLAKNFMLIASVGAVIYTMFIKTDISNIYVYVLIIIICLSTYFDFAYATKYYIYFLANREIFKYQIAQIAIQGIKIILVLSCYFIKIDLIILMFGISILVLVKTYILKKIFKDEQVDLKENFQLRKIKDRKAVFMHQILGMVIYNSSSIIMSIAIDTTAVSVFSIYNLIFGTFYGFLGMIYSQTVLPVLGHLLAGKDRSEAKRIHEKYNKLCILVNLTIMCVTVIMIESFLNIYLKGSEIEYYSYSIATLFAFYTLINSIKVPYQTLINADGKFKETIVHSVIEVCIFIIILIGSLKNLTISSFILALLGSSIYKMISLKWYCNKKIMKESYIQHIQQCLAIVILGVVNAKPLLEGFKVNSVFVWISVATICLGIMIIICKLIFYVIERCGIYGEKYFNNRS